MHRVHKCSVLIHRASTEWEIERAQLRMDGKLGEGEFGVVYRYATGMYTGRFLKCVASPCVCCRAGWNGTPVAAKVLKVHNITLGDLRTEVSVLRRVHHPNVVQFLGACVEKARCSATVVMLRWALC